MFDIDELKEMKLLELQEIAQKIEVPKFRQLKKLDLVYQILDVQASNPKQVKEKAGSALRPKRKRISKQEGLSGLAIPTEEIKPTENKTDLQEKKEPVGDESKPEQPKPEQPKLEQHKPEQRQKKESTAKPVAQRPDNRERKPQAARQEQPQAAKQEAPQAAKQENGQAEKQEHARSKSDQGQNRPPNRPQNKSQHKPQAKNQQHPQHQKDQQHPKDQKSHKPKVNDPNKKQGKYRDPDHA